MYGSSVYYQVTQGKHEYEYELSITGGSGAPLIGVVVESTDGRDFLVDDQDEDGVLWISVRRMDKQLVQRAVSAAIGKPVSITWPTADREERVA